MVAVDSQGNIVNVGYNFVKEGIPYRVVSITVPTEGCIGSMQAVDTTNNVQIKIYPTKFGGKWSKDLQYTQVKLPQKTKLLAKGKRL